MLSETTRLEREIEETELRERLEVAKKEEKASFLYMVLRRFKETTLGLFSLGLVAAIVFFAIFAPYLTPYDPRRVFFESLRAPPSLKHLLGTNMAGQDELSRLIYGTRTALEVGLVAVGVIFLVGFTFGALAGYYGGVVDEIFMRVVDIMMTMPTLFFAMLMVSVIQVKTFFAISLVIGLTSWTQLARVIRSEFLSVRELPYVEAARAMGASDFRIITKHILVNSIGPIVVILSTQLGSAILSEASLSFLGLGAAETISWGGMVARSRGAFPYGWWMATFPGILITVTVLAYNILGDALRDVIVVK